ncbi:MAG: tryptophan synthase subunit alpha [SAR92 bacterium BACL26 MAG-121220-bin70]|jgi:tryptophan synthase alpha chain|uniref:Tryptophan synthase alpha chain n=1 Tax=SAR92 bacterium BACL26 MAG-121220-bin70 TaxID=1655626 RepID=A0A0R2TYB7_9GAMM|nr:MAG: tryptophan synthase subunit alpha [SAR92 bacterium BACL26 MAG-121220-bin70]|tara:strand:+ start:5567 stop:6334 length:768 start_codon:yes stop_codon:yes gene_type:complete
MGLQAYIEERKKDRDLLVMAHVVCGYPSFEDNMQELEIMAEAGVDLVELQFPFSEPSADGPLFVKANEQSLKSGTTVDQCFDFMKRASERFPFKILMMGYYNTAFKMGEEVFVNRIKASGGVGYILPDLPVEESSNLHKLSEQAGIEPIILMTPTSSDKRLAILGKASRGMVYVVARKGVTGSKTNMGDDVISLVERCRQHTDVPMGVGFGISCKADMDFLRGTADLAIVGTAALKTWESSGAEGLRVFFAELMA